MSGAISARACAIPTARLGHPDHGIVGQCGVATATLAAAVGKVDYICGFSITSAGSTAAAVVSPTVTSVITSTMTFTYTTVAGATLANAPLVVPFNPCISAATPNTTIPVSVPSLGAGNTNTTVNAWGFQR